MEATLRIMQLLHTNLACSKRGKCAGLITLVCVILLGGCVVIPLLEDPPYDEAGKTIEIGETTRKDVLFTLGEPAMVGRDGAFFAYTEYQAKLGLLFFAAHPTGGAAAGSMGLGTKHLLAIAFDENGVVLNVELSTKDTLEGGRRPAETSYCISTGECFVSFGAEIVAFATPAEDRDAKFFAATPNSCALYLYPEGDFGFPFSVFLDEQVRLWSIDDGYFLWRLEPGQHRIAALLEPYGYGADLNVECVADKSLYVKYFSPGIFVNMDLALVTAAEGQTGVRSGRLLLDNL